MPIETVSGTDLKYYLITFDAAGNERSDDPDGQMSQRVMDILSNEPRTDVFIFSHSWLGDVPAARNQYGRWIKVMAEQKSDIERIKQAHSEFRPLLIGLHWPSLPWGDEELGSDPVSFEPTVSNSAEQFFVEQYAKRIADTDAARQALRTIFRAADKNLTPEELPPDVKEAYQELDREAALGNEGVDAAPGADRESFNPEGIFTAVKWEPLSFGNFDRGAILAPLKMLSFWKMKQRARQFGESGGSKLLRELQRGAKSDVRFHLMGHSFGCIVVSAMIAGPNGHAALERPVNSVVLVQGAVSHWSYCPEIPEYIADAKGRAGYFHSIVAEHKVNGPIITTQSEYDTAVRKAYPLAAGIVNSTPDLAPGKFPKYGGLGTFGARGGESFEVVDMEMLLISASYQFEPGKIYNLLSNKFIGDHNDIARPEVAHAVWEAAQG